MKIEKLELKHICGYLPYGLNLKIDTSNWFEKREPFIAKLIGIFDFEHLTVKYADGSDTSYTDNMRRFTPLLLPLSALTEPEYNFIYENETDYESIENLVKMDCESFMCCKFSFEFWQKLYSKHFDIYGLIDAGLAIDKRTVKL